MGILDFFRKKSVQQDNNDEKIIDLSDSKQYPASVLADLNCVFALGDDSENFLHFIQNRWTKPSFHWGWDDISHDDAVNSDFLFRAISNMNTQYRKRRDAMIASEGYKFIWKRKELEPVPGLMSGEQLCDILNRCLDRDMVSIKNINASEDRDARRWKLNPTYDDLMAELEKNESEADYFCRDMGCGMLRFTNKSYGNKQSFIVNTALKKAYPISAADGTLVGFTKDDIDWDSVSKLENNGDAYRLQACYYFGVEDYKDGVAQVDWMLYPDGRYFADEDGFGMEDNDEVNVYAYIDTECRVLVKFQDKEGKSLFNEALKKLQKRNGVLK